MWPALCTTPGGAICLRLCEEDAVSSCAGTNPTRGPAASSSGPFMKLSLSPPAGGSPSSSERQCIHSTNSYSVPSEGPVHTASAWVCSTSDEQFAGSLPQAFPVLSWPTAAIFVNMGQTGQGWSQNFGHTTDLWEEHPQLLPGWCRGLMPQGVAGWSGSSDPGQLTKPTWSSVFWG